MKLSFVLSFSCTVSIRLHASCAIEEECFWAANGYLFCVLIVLHFSHLFKQAHLQLCFLICKHFHDVTLLIVSIKLYPTDEFFKVGDFCSHHFHKVLAVLFEWFVLHRVPYSLIDDLFVVFWHDIDLLKESVFLNVFFLCSEFRNTINFGRILHELAKKIFKKIQFFFVFNIWFLLAFIIYFEINFINVLLAFLLAIISRLIE